MLAKNPQGVVEWRSGGCSYIFYKIGAITINTFYFLIFLLFSVFSQYSVRPIAYTLWCYIKVYLCAFVVTKQNEAKRSIDKTKSEAFQNPRLLYVRHD